MKCTNCGSTDMVVIQETSGFSLTGLLSAFLFLLGIVALLIAPAFGLLVILVSLIIGIFGRGKSNYLACLACKNKTRI